MITFSQIGRHGRIGNQMFQYATLFALAKSKNFTLGMPYANKTDIDYPNFCLKDCFPNITAIDSSNIRFRNSYHETSFAYENKILNVQDDTDIFGYFQSEKYFANYKNELRREFQFAQKYYAEAKAIKDSFSQDAIVLHIRLGDYTWKQHYHPICDLAYYSRALESIPDVANKQILLFSDDVPQAQQILQNLNFKAMQTGNKFVEMCLMSLCEYHIIANSTFSWWGAYLSNSKKIIAPANWFGRNSDAPQNWHDVYCENWTIL
jgi:hypothetical protein